MERRLERRVSGKNRQTHSRKRTQTLAEVEVEGLHPLLATLTEPVTVGRIGDQEAPAEVAEWEGTGGIRLGHGDLALQSSRAHVGPCGLDGLGVPIEAADWEGRSALIGPGVGAEPVERGLRLGAEGWPALDVEGPVERRGAAD